MIVTVFVGSDARDSMNAFCSTGDACLLFFFVLFFLLLVLFFFFFFQAGDGIRDLVRSRGLGDVYKKQCATSSHPSGGSTFHSVMIAPPPLCLLYPSHAAVEEVRVILGGRR